MSRYLSKERGMFEYMESLMARINATDATVNEHVLVLELPLKDKSKNYEFNFLSKKNDRDTEIKVDTEDIFLCSGIKLEVQKVKEVDGQIIPVSPAVTYADVTFFPGVKSGEKEVDAIAAVFDAKLTLDSKLNKRLVNFSTNNLLHIPQTKTANLPAYTLDENGYYNLVQPFMVSGRAENKMKLDLPYLLSAIIEGGFDAEGDAVTDGSYNIVRLRCRGMIGMNAANAYASFVAAKGTI